MHTSYIRNILEIFYMDIQLNHNIVNKCSKELQHVTNHDVMLCK